MCFNIGEKVEILKCYADEYNDALMVTTIVTLTVKQKGTKINFVPWLILDLSSVN